MPRTISASVGHGRMTPYAQHMLKRFMYKKGQSFLGASVLLSQRGGDGYVVLHLFCQGVEIILKALLLLNDYEKYSPRLRMTYGHDLSKLARRVASIYKLKPMRKELAEELQVLNNLYAPQLMRYGSIADIFIDPNSISHQLAATRIAAVMRLADRKSAFA
jgi:hypothetical protein